MASRAAQVFSSPAYEKIEAAMAKLDTVIRSVSEPFDFDMGRIDEADEKCRTCTCTCSHCGNNPKQ